MAKSLCCARERLAEQEVMTSAHLPASFDCIVIGLTELLNESCLVLLGYT